MPTVIAELANAGVVVVASAGNEGGPVDTPANCQRAVGVGGLRQVGTKVGFSSLGPELALSAPGGNCVNLSGECLYPINTTTNLGSTTPGANGYTDGFNINVGTSFSAPIVSGIGGLMLSVNGNLSAAQVRARLIEGVAAFPVSTDATVPQCHVPVGPNDVQVSECNCTASTCGAGMANASGAVLAALRPIAAVVTPNTVSPGQAVALSAASSMPADGHTIASYAWLGTSLASAPDQPGVTAVAPTSGSTLVCVTVTDDAGRQDTAVVSVRPTSAAWASASAGTNPCLIVMVTVTPSLASVTAGAGQTFLATVANSTNTAVDWSVNGISGGDGTVGTISAAGLYTAPASVAAAFNVVITAAWADDSTRFGTAQVTVNPPPPPPPPPAPQTSSGGGATGMLELAGARRGRPAAPATSGALNGLLNGSAFVRPPCDRRGSRLHYAAKSVPFGGTMNRCRRAVLLGAVVVALAAPAFAQSGPRAAALDFAARALTAPPRSWPTNGGNLYNQRYSPLNADQRRQRRPAEGRLARAATRLGRCTAILGRSSTARIRRHCVREHGRRRRVRALARQRRDPLAVRGAPRSEPDLGLLRLDEPRRRARRRQGVRRPARRQARRARSADRQGRLVDAGRALAGQLLDHRRAAVPRRQGHRRFRGRRPRHARPREGVRREATASCCGRSTRSRARASPVTTAGRRTTTPGNTAAARSGRRRRPIPSSASCISRPATRARTTTARTAPATTCTRPRSSRSTRPPGKYRWHFQQVHHDIWDYDASNPVVLMDLNVDGRTRKALVEVGKTGFAYILDRATGEPIVGIDERPVPQEPRQATAATQPFPRGDAVVPQVSRDCAGRLRARERRAGSSRRSSARIRRS